MSDSYQAIYDAVRSRIPSCDPNEIIRNAVHLDASHAIACFQQDFSIAAAEMQRPSVLFRPEMRVRPSTQEWVVSYSGVNGVGKTPDAAMRAFDKAWITEFGK